jgi:hypothetical protein
MKPKLLAAVLGLTLLAAATHSAAADKVRCELLTIEASNAGQGIDPALMAHAAVLQKAPFASFNTFKLVQRQGYELTLGAPAALAMPAPLRGSLTFNSLLEGRLDITLSIERPAGGPVIINGKASPGSPFFAAGLKSDSGRWVFGIVCDRGNGVIQH